jgi:hypothetical protein
MSGNGGFPPLKMIEKDINNNLKSNKKESKKERFFSDKKNIVNINQIISEVKRPMIEMNKEEIKIIDSF